MILDGLINKLQSLSCSHSAARPQATFRTLLVRNSVNAAVDLQSAAEYLGQRVCGLLEPGITGRITVGPEGAWPT